MVLGLGTLLGGALLGGALLGGKRGGSGTPATQVTGIAAMPPEFQKLFATYVNAANNFALNDQSANRLSMYNEPNPMFRSAGLTALQESRGNQGVLPIGVIEPFNQYQANALTKLGEGNVLSDVLMNYINPFQNQVTNRAIEGVNRQYDIANSQLRDQINAVNPRVFGNSATATQLALQEEARNRTIGDLLARLNYQGYNEGTNLRDRVLSQMLNAGGAIQSQNQSMLQAASGRGVASSSPEYGRLQALGALLGVLPNSSSSTGGVPREPSNLSKLSGLGLALLGSQNNGLASLFGGL